MRIVGLTAGHNASDPGAINDPLQENLLTLRVLGFAMAFLAEKGVYVVSPTGKLSRKIQELNRHSLECAVEIHFNSATATTASGIESIYHPGSVKGRNLANFLFDKLEALPFLKGRRVVDTNHLGRRLAFTRDVMAPAVIIEPLWISNPDEKAVAMSQDNLKIIGETIGQAILEFLQLGA